MTEPRILLTGPTGCIGAATVRSLIREGAGSLVGLSRTCDVSRLGDAASHLDQRAVDLTDGDAMGAALRDVRPTHVIHLAAAQTPFCNEHPLEGLRINLEGTTQLLRQLAGHRDTLQRVVFASSAAVYGARAIYPGPTVRPDDELRPVNHYGRWKQAGEAAVQAFHEETGIACVSLRLATTYGPGRDLGLTSAPTTALKQAALGRSFRMPYAGRECYHYVEDVGAAFMHACVDPVDGHRMLNLRGITVDGTTFLQHIRDAAETLGMPTPDLAVADDAAPNTFVCDLDEEEFVQTFPRAPKTALDEGVRESLAEFRRAAEAGSLS